jgi:hypothetical protein
MEQTSSPFVLEVIACFVSATLVGDIIGQARPG